MNPTQPMFGIDGTPIHRLPPELLSLIFQHFAPNQTNRWTTTGIWTLSGVCQRWRQLTRSNPTWWSWITLKADPVQGWLEGRGDLIELQLELSKSQPLQVMLEEDAWSIHDEFIDFCRTALEPHFPRLSFISITSLYYRIPHLFSTDVDDYMPILPLLERFEAALQVSSKYQPGMIGLTLNHVTAPSLTQVHLTEFYGSDNMDLPWSQLSMLTLEDCGLSKLVPVLPLLDPACLKELSITVQPGIDVLLEATVYDIALTHPSTRTFPNVNAFIFGLSTIDEGASVEFSQSSFTIREFIFAHFLFPRLSSLTMKGIRFGDNIPLAQSPFMAAMSSSLTRIHLVDVGLVASEDGSISSDDQQKVVERVLAQLPNLEHIRISDECEPYDLDLPVSPPILSLLASTNLCPKLRSLYIDSVETEQQTLLAMVRSRMSPISIPVHDRLPLRSVEIIDIRLLIPEQEKAAEFDPTFVGYNDGATMLDIRKYYHLIAQ